MNKSDERKAKVPEGAYNHATQAASALGMVHGELKAVITNGECKALFPTFSLPRDKVELTDDPPDESQ